MLLVRSAESFPFQIVERGCVATVGAFDGLHLGHKRLLRRVLDEAVQRNVPSAVISFEPTPKEFFSAGQPPARLMRFREKYDALAQEGIDLFYCPRFDQRLRDIDAVTFVRQLLVHNLNVDHLVVGDDFRFARAREGDTALLRRIGAAVGFSTEDVPSVVVDGERVSSTAIRDALAAGHMQRASALLGRSYRMSGRVVPGERVGRTLGYPTANVNLQRRQSAVLGIFAVRVHGLREGAVDGVASVGTRPTFNKTKPILEVHLFDFDRDIYGEYIHVDFVKRLRSEKKFDTVDKLVEQMHEDAARARSALAA